MGKRNRGWIKRGELTAMSVRGIRGAITVEVNEEGTILDATIELLNGIVEVNDFTPEDIASVFVTVTQDLDATFPARAIRQMQDGSWCRSCALWKSLSRAAWSDAPSYGTREHGSFPEGSSPRLSE
jgi:hypothetical protein